MNINFNNLLNSVAYQFKDQTVRIFTDQQKKIIVIVTGVLGLFGLSWACYKLFYFKAEFYGEEHKPNAEIAIKNNDEAELKDDRAIIAPENALKANDEELAKIQEVRAKAAKPNTRDVINSAFVGKYAFDTLPDYSLTAVHIINEPIQADQITHPVMKGRYKNYIGEIGDFIVIKVQEIENNEIKFITLLQSQDMPAQDGNFNNVWRQGEILANESHEEPVNPIFFSGTGNFTGTNAKLLPSQETNFKLLQNLLQNGASQDTQGKIWKIVV